MDSREFHQESPFNCFWTSKRFRRHFLEFYYHENLKRHQYEDNYVLVTVIFFIKSIELHEVTQSRDNNTYTRPTHVFLLWYLFTTSLLWRYLISFSHCTFTSGTRLYDLMRSIILNECTRETRWEADLPTGRATAQHCVLTRDPFARWLARLLLQELCCWLTGACDVFWSRTPQ